MIGFTRDTTYSNNGIMNRGILLGEIQLLDLDIVDMYNIVRTENVFLFR